MYRDYFFAQPSLGFTGMEDSNEKISSEQQFLVQCFKTSYAEEHVWEHRTSDFEADGLQQQKAKMRATLTATTTFSRILFYDRLEHE